MPKQRAMHRVVCLLLAFLAALALALVGGAVPIALAGGDLTIGAAAGLLAVLAVAARSGIVLIRRYQHLRRREGHAFGRDLVVMGAQERLVPSLASAAGIALVFVPFVALGDLAGYEILRPMAVVILCGLVTATAVSLLLVPALYLRFGAGVQPGPIPEEELMRRWAGVEPEPAVAAAGAGIEPDAASGDGATPERRAPAAGAPEHDGAPSAVDAEKGTAT